MIYPSVLLILVPIVSHRLVDCKHVGLRLRLNANLQQSVNPDNNHPNVDPNFQYLAVTAFFKKHLRLLAYDSCDGLTQFPNGLKIRQQDWYIVLDDAPQGVVVYSQITVDQSTNNRDRFI
jgi:hypothetical protein